MRKLLFGFIAALVSVAFVATEAGAAKRMGGGGSVGAQRNVAKTPPTATPGKPAQAQQAAPAQGAAAPGAAQPASGMSKWAPLLGGLALGGMLGWLMGANGLGGLMVGILLAALLAFAAMFVIRMVMAKRGEPARPVQYAGGMGSETVAAPPPSQAAGFDVQPTPLAAASVRVPAGFDTAGFLRGAKMNFMKLQLANDRGDLAELAEYTSPELLESLTRDIQSRAGAKQHTDVTALNADLLEVVTEGDKHWASVRFSGLMRESPAEAPVGFEEVWNLSKPVDGSGGWQLSGIQQMH